MMKRALAVASLVMKPEGYNDGSLPSLIPKDRSGDFTFTRGSNLAATRVNQAGLIEKGRENLLLQSNQFDTTWANTSSAETAGQPDKDGGTDAWLLEKNNANGRIAQFINTSGVKTFSVYAKAGTLDWVSLWTNVGTSYFDLSSGTKGSTGASTTISSAIESVGNGWYRCSLIFNTAINAVRIYPADGDLDTSGTSGNILIQDAQLEVGLVATDVIETTTTAAQAGVLENTPRLDYSGGATEPSLLLEPQRRNYYTYSEYFSGAGWTIGRGVLTYNNATSPEGRQNAVKWQMTSDTGAHYLRQSRTSTSTWSLSVFVKKGNYRYVGLRCAGANASFDLDTGTFASGSGYIEPLDNGWYRIGLTETGNGTFQYYGVYYANPDATERNDATGNEYYHIYGAQFEAGSYLTSYIPTYGTTVTRAADAMNNSSLGLTDCTFFVDFVPRSSIMGLLDFYDNSNARAFYIAINSVKTLQFNSVQGGTIGDALGPITIGDRMKLGFTLNASTGSITIFANGTKYNTYSTGISSLNKILQVSSFGYYNNTEFNQILTFPTALTDSECIALTTI